MDKPKCRVKNAIKKILQLKVKVGLKFDITFLTQHLGLSIHILPKFGFKQPNKGR